MGMQGYKDTGIWAAGLSLPAGACASSPAQQPQEGIPRQCRGAGALLISPSAWERTGWGKPACIMFVPLI